MARQTDWLQILVECKDNILKQMGSVLKTRDQSMPNLGVGAGGDPIKQIDLVAENTIVKTFRMHKISFTLISEESGVKEYGKFPHEHFITIDPIDGTTNFMRGIPFYATSIAISTNSTLNTIYAALVADIYHDVTYTAQKRKGAYRNSQRIAPSRATTLEEAVIGMDLNTYNVQRIAPQLTNLIRRTKHIRHLGANALELCYVADGTSDAFVDIRGKLRATDIAAAWLIIKEAGAEITTLEGEPLSIRLDPKQTVAFIAAANEKIREVILKLIRT